MRAVISDYAEVGAGSIVGEMGLVKNHQRLPKNGSPSSPSERAAPITCARQRSTASNSA
jgi:carbonic anhydrase/acetyltransferase-like protein (isoleucine patch superfamily)